MFVNCYFSLFCGEIIFSDCVVSLMPLNYIMSLCYEYLSNVHGGIGWIDNDLHLGCIEYLIWASLFLSFMVVLLYNVWVHTYVE